MSPFVLPIDIHFDDADPRGLLFYGRLQVLAHRVFETFVVGRLVDRWEDWFENQSFLAPIRRAESVYHHPLRPGRRYDAELRVIKVGETSFEIAVRFVDRRGSEPVVCAEARVVKVFASPSTMCKMPIPSEIRRRLLEHLESQ